MSTSTLTARPELASRTPEPGSIRSALPVWAALFLNVLAFSGVPTVSPLPMIVGQLLTQGAVLAAFVLALMANPRGVIRPNLFLVLLTMLAVVALMVSIHNEFVLGVDVRACRLLIFIAVLWLLTAWWGRSDFALVRAHLTCLRVVLGTVLIGAIVAPGSRSPTTADFRAYCGRFRPLR